MADQGPAAEPSSDEGGGGARTRREPDSVDALLEGEFSQSIVDEVKTYGRPSWLQEDSSMEPWDDLEEYVQRGFRFPPKDYEEFQEAAAEELEALKRLREPVDPDAKRRAQRRTALVAGRSEQDVKWLKLKAYHRAMDRIRAERAAEPDPAAREALMARSGVPLDLVPVSELDKSPETLAAEAAMAARPPVSSLGAYYAGAAEEAQRAGQQQNPSTSGKSAGAGYERGEYSESSEWEPGWAEPSYQSHPFSQAYLLEYLGELFPDMVITAPLEVFPSDEEQQPGYLEAGGGEGTAQRRLQQAGAPSDSPYTTQYLHRRQVLDAHRSWRRRRQQAFWLSFAGAAAIGALKLLRSRRRGAAAAAAGGKQSQARLARRSSNADTDTQSVRSSRSAESAPARRRSAAAGGTT